MNTDGVMGEVLPMYFVGDVSMSMAGEPIGALNEALSGLRDGVAQSPSIGEKVRFAIITFAGSATSVLDIAELSDDMALPVLECEGNGTNYTAIFRELALVLPADVQMLRNANLKVRRPAVFFLSDGEPTVAAESWQQALGALKDPRFRERPNILAFGIGAASGETIRAVASEPRYAWVAADGASAAQSISEFGTALLQSMSRSADALARGDETIQVPEPAGFVSLRSDLL